MVQLIILFYLSLVLYIQHYIPLQYVVMACSCDGVIIPIILHCTMSNLFVCMLCLCITKKASQGVEQNGLHGLHSHKLNVDKATKIITPLTPHYTTVANKNIFGQFGRFCFEV